MYTPLLRNILSCVVAVAVLSMCNTAFAQGTANGPVTQHEWNGGFAIFIGGPNDPLNPNPVPIDLDLNGAPWIKEIFPITPGLTPTPGQKFLIHETIINVGTEAWTDWHEHILDNGQGIIPGFWASVQVLINGVGLPFIVTGLGTPDLGLTTFPIQPGDILEIVKEMAYTGPAPTDPNLPFLTIAEYPTPEPASAALMGIGSLLVLVRRRSVTESQQTHNTRRHAGDFSEGGSR